MKEFQATPEVGDFDEKTKIMENGVLVTELVISEGMTLTQVRQLITAFIQYSFTFLLEGDPLAIEDEETIDAIAIKVDSAIFLQASEKQESIL